MTVPPGLVVADQTGGRGGGGELGCFSLMWTSS